nr:ER membrane protein complex subunit 1-like [Ipomoea batatas]
MEKEPGDADVVFYRANLTFVDMEDAELLRIRMERTKAMHVISLSAGSTLRAWNLPDGQTVWESFLGILAGSSPSRSYQFY